MVDNWQLDKYQANLKALVDKFDTWFFPDQDFYEAYEREILMYANEMAQKQYEYSNVKIDYDKLYQQKYEEFGTQTETDKKTGEQKQITDAEAKRRTSTSMLDSTCWVDRFEATTKMYMDILNNYRRFWEVIKSRLIKDMSDQKRLSTVQKWESIWTIASDMN